MSKNQETLPPKQAKCHLSVMLSISRKQWFLLHAEFTPVKLQSINIPSVSQPCCVQFGVWHPAVPTHDGDNLHRWQMCIFTVQTLMVDVQNREAFQCKSSMSQGNQAHCQTNIAYSHSSLRLQNTQGYPPWWACIMFSLFLCQMGNFLRAGL